MLIKPRLISRNKKIMDREVHAKARQLVEQEGIKSGSGSVCRRKSGLSYKKNGFKPVQPKTSKRIISARSNRIINTKDKKILEKACIIVEREDLNINRNSIITCLLKNKPFKNNNMLQFNVSKSSYRKRIDSTALTRKISKPSSVIVGYKETKWLSQKEVTIAVNNAVRQDIERKKKQKLPIARYDKDSKRAYLENADGTREYV